jgi:undecaprenyl-diphosphatase
MPARNLVRRLESNTAACLALLRRRSRRRAPPQRRAWRWSAAAAAVTAVIATMILLDAAAVAVVQALPEPVSSAFDRYTDLGKSVWLLVPIAVLLAAIALISSHELPRMARGTLAAVAVRLVFLFTAVALPGLVLTVVKRLIGRARPLVEGAADPFLFRPFGWSVEYASLPSGHAADAFAIAMALGSLWPRWRPLLWAYAGAVAVSRVVLTAHFPSDVVAGAAIGVAGVLLVREWFLARGLAFAVAPGGRIRPLPGPSRARIKRVARHLVGP